MRILFVVFDLIYCVVFDLIHALCWIPVDYIP